MMMREALQSHLGNSMLAEQVARGVNVQWWSEFSAQAGPLGSTFRPSIIGFAAVLDNLSAFADGESRPSPLLWLGAAYLSAVAVPDRRHPRPLRPRAADAIVRVLHGMRRVLRAVPATRAVHGARLLRALRSRPPAAAGRLVCELDAGRHRRTDGVFRAPGLYAVFGALLVPVSIIFDYAKVRAVVEDRRSMIGAVAAGARFARRNAGAVAALYALTGCAVRRAPCSCYAMAAPGARFDGRACRGSGWPSASSFCSAVYGSSWCSSRRRRRSSRAGWRTPATLPRADRPS